RETRRQLCTVVPNGISGHRNDLAIDELIAVIRLSFGPYEELVDIHPNVGDNRHVHRSTSPNTMSIEPRMADTSASRWPRQRKSIAWRCAKPGARILHL